MRHSLEQCVLLASRIQSESYIAFAVHQSGELDELLVKNGIIPPEEAQKEEA